MVEINISSSTEALSAYMSAGALFISILSFIFAIKSWRESNRPIVTALIRCPHSGNTSTGLEIVISNSGNRPALEVELHVPEQELQEAFLAPSGDKLREAVERCFSKNTIIPVLEGGREVSNSFGVFTINDTPDTWRYKAILKVRIQYKDLDGRKYCNSNKLWIVCNKGFALSYFGE